MAMNRWVVVTLVGVLCSLAAGDADALRTDGNVVVNVNIKDGSGSGLKVIEHVSVAAYSVIQFDDICTRFNIAPQANVQVDLLTQPTDDVIYGYASVVRDGTGDAVFIFGTSPNV